MSGRDGRMRPFVRIGAILLGLLAAPGCFGPARGPAPPPPDLWKPPSADNAGSAASAVFPPVVPIPETAAPAGSEELQPPADNQVLETRKEEGAPETRAERGVPTAPAASPAPGEVAGPGREAPPAPPQAASALPPEGGSRGPSGRGTPAPHPPPPGPAEATSKPKTVPVPEAGGPTRDTQQAGPGWSRQKEVLSYRVDFIGITMGYARFSYQGKVSIGGKVAYHLNVRAWTSGVLAYIYPINETIDYYLDTETLAPIRQEFTQRANAKDDVAIYDQETGKITYRFRESGEIRKQVQTVPEVYDPVSVAYYFRWKDVGGEERARNVYAGRKIWQISARLLGTERLHTDLGQVDTLLIQPVIRREGKLEDKGDLKMWVSDDARRVPVRLYAKFHKIRDWTLVGELMAAQKGG